MAKPKPIDLIAVAIMLVLCLSWAFQQITVKFALPEIGPFGQGTIRSAGATIIVSLFMIARASRTPWVRGLNGPGLLTGVLFGIEFMLLYLALVHTDASRAVMFLYTAPFVVAIGGHIMLPGERLDAKSVAGILLAFGAVVITLNPATESTPESWKGDLMAVGAGIGWGLTTLVVKGSNLRTCPAAQVLWYQLLVSTLMFFVAGMLVGDSPFVPMSGIALASVLYQTVWVAGITFGIWFALIAKYSATSLSVITFVTPLAGALMGYLILDEPLGARHLFAVVAVAAGILLVSLPRKPANPSV